MSSRGMSDINDIQWDLVYISTHLGKETRAYISCSIGIAEQLSTATNNVTEAMLLGWNQVQGSCDDLVPQILCAG